MSLFFRRSDDGAPWLHARLWLFGIGAAIALAGIALDDDRVIGAAILILAVGFLLRLLPGRDGEP